MKQSLRTWRLEPFRIPGRFLGSACSCEGDGCFDPTTGTIPVPNGGTIIGCDAMGDLAGAEEVCLRSYEGMLATNTYFANGFCSLMATQCTGAALICDSAVFGVYADMTACPAGKVMISFSQDVSAMGQDATIDNKICTPITHRPRIAVNHQPHTNNP